MQLGYKSLLLLSAFFVSWVSCVIKLPEYPPFDINPDILPRGQNDARTFADIRIGEGLIDWQPYDLDVASVPLNPATRKQYSDGRDHTIIKGTDGKPDYECFLPQEPSPEDEQPSAGDSAASRMQELKHRIESLKKICLRHSTGNWEFEVCPMKHVKQMKKERKPGTLAMNAVFPGGAAMSMPDAVQEMMSAILGKAEHDVITDEYFVGRYIPDDPNSDRLLNGRLVQQYVDGDRCDVESEVERGGVIQRQAEVRFECSLAQPKDHIMDVTEISSCQYNIRVGSPRLCSSQSMLSSSKRSVRCFPLADIPTQPSKSKDTTQGNVGKKNASKKIKDKRKIWNEKITAILSQGQNQFPMIHKIMTEFLHNNNAQLLDMTELAEGLPDETVKMLLSSLGIEHPLTDADGEDENQGEKNRNRIANHEPVLFRIEL